MRKKTQERRFRAMPFDALPGTLEVDSLTALLEQRNVKPVDWDALAAHKEAQLRAFGPSFWYRHQTLLGITLIGSIAFMAVTAGAANAIASPLSSVPLWISMAWMCLIAALIVGGVFRARAGSHWEERWLPADMLKFSGVPEPIAALARSMKSAIPGSTLILGELVRESAVIDPYLLLVRGDERVCLGIWDDRGTVVFAK
jgi:hypothetical protein